MTNLWKRRFLYLTAAVGLALCATASAKDMVNIIKNSGFEDGLPEPWSVYHVGVYKVVRNPATAHGGNYYATFAADAKGYVLRIAQSGPQSLPGHHL